jgi:hypothetical protein
VDAPHCTTPTHGYGQPFGTWPEEPDWAGSGFTAVPDPATLEPQPADAAA